jgi:hypothetical protein
LLIYPLVYELWKRNTVTEYIAEEQSVDGEKQQQPVMALVAARD